MVTNSIKGINRRQLLGWLAAAPLLAKTQLSQASETQVIEQQAQRLYASAAKNVQGGYYLSFFNALGQEQTSQPLPARAHQVLADPVRGWLFTLDRKSVV